MSQTVLIIGCGIAGPVLALLLKQKGYSPVVFEKVKELGNAGASLMLQPNGMKVLNLVGLASTMASSSIASAELRDQTSTGKTLGLSHLPGTLIARYGQPAVGVRRTLLNLELQQMLIAQGIELHQGHALEEIEEHEDRVVAVFQGGRRREGVFLVGCDGIKAVSRQLLLRVKGIPQGLPSYTGLTQTAGISPTPPSIQNQPGMLNVYGSGAHIIAYPVSPTHTSWAITLPETAEASETWRLYGPEEQKALSAKLSSQFASWSTPVPELVASAERLTKFGLFDRNELEPDQWHTRRCVLVGDAAHPTSPHLGQGANQALEDCYHLGALLPSADSAPVRAEQLDSIFRAFAEKRQPRTKELVRGARAQGERRVVTGGEDACEQRDRAIMASWKDERAIEEKYDSLFREPF